MTLIASIGNKLIKVGDKLGIGPGCCCGGDGPGPGLHYCEHCSNLNVDQWDFVGNTTACFAGGPGGAWGFCANGGPDHHTSWVDCPPAPPGLPCNNIFIGCGNTGPPEIPPDPVMGVVAHTVIVFPRAACLIAGGNNNTCMFRSDMYGYIYASEVEQTPVLGGVAVPCPACSVLNGFTVNVQTKPAPQNGGFFSNGTVTFTCL